MMGGYSEIALPKKLGIKEGFIIYAKNPPSDYEELISPLPEGVVLCKRLSSDLDIIHLFTKNREELSSNIEKYSGRIKKNGMIWISWPKKSSKIPTDITEDVIREVVLPPGLVDIKVCAVDDVCSGLKLVIRKENLQA